MNAIALLWFCFCGVGSAYLAGGYFLECLKKCLRRLGPAKLQRALFGPGSGNEEMRNARDTFRPLPLIQRPHLVRLLISGHERGRVRDPHLFCGCGEDGFVANRLSFREVILHELLAHFRLLAEIRRVLHQAVAIESGASVAVHINLAGFDSTPREGLLQARHEGMPFILPELHVVKLRLIDTLGPHVSSQLGPSAVGRQHEWQVPDLVHDVLRRCGNRFLHVALADPAPGSDDVREYFDVYNALNCRRHN
mmetsp:Transcript_32881/g.55068  ORF Transcript_32881/g.55068 Transcript_32881/m.55068 type:complete len:251 (+) Transcript_32881:283-1035(+)